MLPVPFHSILFFLSLVLSSNANDVVCPVSVSQSKCLRVRDSIIHRLAHAGRARADLPHPDTWQHNSDIVRPQEARSRGESDKTGLHGAGEVSTSATSSNSSAVTSGVRRKRATIGIRGLRWTKTWPNDLLVYSFSTENGGYSEAEKTIIRASMAFIASQSCVRFREVPYWQWNRGVLHISDPGPQRRTLCRSYVGYNRYDILRMNLGDRCISPEDSAVAHEVFHILGFYHEHTRTDRDDYIVFRSQYVPRGAERAYAKNRLGDPLSTEYDTESIMQYKVFSTFPPVMLPKPPERYLGQTWAPTLMDMYELNSLYGCSSMLGLGSTLTCHGCIRRLFVVAKTSALQTFRGSTVQLDWVVKENNRFVKKRFFLTTTHKAGRAFRAGNTDFWQFAVPGCITPQSVQMMALRATSRRSWRPTQVDLFFELYPRHTLLVSSVSLDKKLVKLGTEKETQHLLPSVKQPTCSTCRSDCINQLNVFMDHVLPSNTLATSTHAIVLSWRREGQSSDFARLDLPVQRHTPRTGQRRTFQSSSVPLDTSRPSTCLTANRIEKVYLASLYSNGDFLFQGSSTRVEQAILTAQTVGGSRLVLAEMTALPSETTAHMIRLKVRKCDSCNKCAADQEAVVTITVRGVDDK